MANILTPSRSVASANVSRRTFIGLPFFAAFAIGCWLTSPTFWSEWWFYAGAVIYIAFVIVEPLYAGARARIANSLGAVASVWSVQHSPVEWPLATFTVVAIALVVVSIALLFAPRGSLQRRVFALLSRASTARGLGLMLLMLESFGQFTSGHPEFIFLAAGSVLLYVGAVVSTLRRLRVKPPRRISIIDVIGPRIVLAELPAGFDGSAITIDDSTVAKVIGIAPSKAGPMGVLALPARWDSIAATYPKIVDLQACEANSIVGVASPGTSVRELKFETREQLELGQVLRLALVDGSAIYYQISSLRLAEASWGSSNYVTSRVRAITLGQLKDGRLQLVAVIPAPHEAVHRVAKTQLTAPLPSGFERIGAVKGTDLPVGIAINPRTRGHMAVLGISGMGKTSVVVRICAALGVDQHVVALDPTGDYLRLYGGTEWESDQEDAPGFHVQDLDESPAGTTKLFIESLMERAKQQYEAGKPVQRFICFEEAHASLPEPVGNSGDERAASIETSKMLLQARKYGIHYLLVSQRTSAVSKSALGQCESFIIFRNVDETTVSYLEAVVGRGIRDALMSLSRFEAICFGPAFSLDGLAIVELDSPAELDAKN